MNEAALLAARYRRPTVDMELVDEAIDRIMAGPERKSRVLSDHERRVIAYHEAGHALVGHVLHHTDPIHKVSIIARGRALGWTLSLPEQDRYLRTRSQLHDDLAMLLGGRTAEEMVFGDPTTGAADDIDRVTTLAKAMVTEYGMSDAIGPRRLGQNQGEVFLGKNQQHEADYSQGVAMTVDSEVERFVTLAHDEARSILTAHIETLDALAEALLEHETHSPRFSAPSSGIETSRPSAARTRPSVSALATSGLLPAPATTGLSRENSSPTSGPHRIGGPAACRPTREGRQRVSRATPRREISPAHHRRGASASFATSSSATAHVGQARPRFP
jgi:cell division protease FtsH